MFVELFSTHFISNILAEPMTIHKYRNVWVYDLITFLDRVSENQTCKWKTDVKLHFKR